MDSGVEPLPHIDFSDWNDREREALHGQLRDLISQHKSFPQAPWAWAAERLARLEPIYDRIAPGDPVVRSQWLFTSHPRLHRPEPLNYEQYEEDVTAARVAALEQVGRGNVQLLAESVEVPWTVGFALADLVSNWNVDPSTRSGHSSVGCGLEAVQLGAELAPRDELLVRPLSRIRPLSRTTIRSAMLTVENRCETRMVTWRWPRSLRAAWASRVKSSCSARGSRLEVGSSKT